MKCRRSESGVCVDEASLWAKPTLNPNTMMKKKTNGDTALLDFMAISIQNF